MARLRAPARWECGYPHAPRDRRRVPGVWIQLEGVVLGGGSARYAGGAEELDARRGCIANRKTRDDNRRLRSHLRGRLRNSRMADVADLAVIFVVCVIVPVSDGMGSQQRKRQQGHNG